MGNGLKGPSSSGGWGGWARERQDPERVSTGCGGAVSDGLVMTSSDSGTFPPETQLLRSGRCSCVLGLSPPPPPISLGPLSRGLFQFWRFPSFFSSNNISGDVYNRFGAVRLCQVGKEGRGPDEPPPAALPLCPAPCGTRGPVLLRGALQWLPLLPSSPLFKKFACFTSLLDTHYLPGPVLMLADDKQNYLPVNLFPFS